MRSIWFCMPAHGRLKLSAICMRQLRRTCDSLTEEGVPATAVVVADDENLDTARDLGFATVRRDNRFVSKRFNDAFQLALDPRHNPHPATHVVPIGSDDWIDYRVLLDLPGPDTMVGFQRISVVREDAGEIMTMLLTNTAGSGIRIYPRELLEPLGFRPCDEDRHRGCDTSTLYRLQRHHGDRLKVEHRHLHNRQVIDWKSAGTQLTGYREFSRYRNVRHRDPFVELSGIYPDESLDEMAAHYGLVAA